jgi:HK97 family phage major capsid protein
MDMSVPFETKVAHSHDTTQDDVLAAFEAFKEANDDRLTQIEKRMSADVITTEKVDRINKAMDELILKSRRPALSVEKAFEPTEHKRAFEGYIRKGDDHGLSAIESKAMSIGSNVDGGYLVPQETEAEIGRLLSKASPIRQIADVR